MSRIFNYTITKTESDITIYAYLLKNGFSRQNIKEIKEWNGMTLLILWLETGRTHQIRVHMKYLGYPLIGDFLYRTDSNTILQDNNTYKAISRQALHAYRLTFMHPITGQKMMLTAPVPDDMLSLFPFPEGL